MLKKIKLLTCEQIFFVSLKKDTTFALRFEPIECLFCISIMLRFNLLIKR